MLRKFQFYCTGYLPGNNWGQCVFGPNCTIATPMHPFRWQERNIKFKEDGTGYDDEYGKPLTIGSNCWISSNVVITAKGSGSHQTLKSFNYPLDRMCISRPLRSDNICIT